MFISIKDKKKEYIINTNRIIEITYNIVLDCFEISYDDGYIDSNPRAYYVIQIEYFKNNKFYSYEVKDFEPYYLMQQFLKELSEV